MQQTTGNSSRTNGRTRQTQGIERPDEHDVLCGRGGLANNFCGNREYRKNVDQQKEDYVRSLQRAQKTAICRELVRQWRSLDPPGRFLDKDDAGLWSEIGEKRARKKTSQLLREDAATIREQVEAQQPHDETSDEERPRKGGKKPPTKANKRSTSPRIRKAKAVVGTGVRNGLRQNGGGRAYQSPQNTAKLPPLPAEEMKLQPRTKSTGYENSGGPVWEEQTNHYPVQGFPDSELTIPYSFDTNFMLKVEHSPLARRTKEDRKLPPSDDALDRKRPAREPDLVLGPPDDDPLHGGTGSELTEVPPPPEEDMDISDYLGDLGDFEAD